jgi:hypothetical protein
LLALAVTALRQDDRQAQLEEQGHEGRDSMDSLLGVLAPSWLANWVADLLSLQPKAGKDGKQGKWQVAVVRCGLLFEWFWCNA